MIIFRWDSLILSCRLVLRGGCSLILGRLVGRWSSLVTRNILSGVLGCSGILGGVESLTRILGCISGLVSWLSTICLILLLLLSLIGRSLVG